MNLSSHSAAGPPCKHMRRFLDTAADGQEHGVVSRYARFHAKGCPRCGTYLRSLEEMIGRLHTTKEPEDPEALARLARKLEE